MSIPSTLGARTRWRPLAVHASVAAVVLAATAVVTGAAPAVAATATASPSSGPTAGGTAVKVTIPAGHTIVQTAAGDEHTLVRATDGTAWAWGSGGNGELGNGSFAASSTPVQVVLPGGRTVTSVSAGGYHSLALASDSTVWAWGRNGDGELGNGTTTDSATPVQVKIPGNRIVIEVAAGGFHSMAMAFDGTVWAWGSNADGQLGNGTTKDSTTPVQVQGLPGGTVRDLDTIAAGRQHSVATGLDGTVYAWGSNSDGQLGNGTTTNATTPVQVKGITGSRLRDIAAGFTHTVGVAFDGTVWAWGSGDHGQLGNGTTNASTTPVKVKMPTGHTAEYVSAGSSHSEAVATDGTVWAWGYNRDGEVGNGTTTDATTPVQSSVSGAGAVAAGKYHVAAAAGGGAATWGDNRFGQLGNGTTTNATTPVQAQIPLTVTGVTVDGAAVKSFTTAVADDGTTSVTFTTPAHAAGTVKVVVTRIGETDTASYTYVDSPAFTSGTPPDGVVGQAYSFTVAAKGTAPVTYSVSKGSLPAGLSLNATSGVISGTPTTVGTSTFTLAATNAKGTATQDDSITIAKSATGFVPAGPVRVLDTRTGTGAPAGQVGAGKTITLTVPNLPAGTTGVVLNLTATKLQGAPTTFVSACPAAQSLSTCTATSAINVRPGRDIANEIDVPVASDGKITLYNNAGSVDLVADLAGFLTSGFTATGPTRVLDTRTGTGAAKAPVGANGTITLTVPNLPSGTKAVVLNLTGTGLTGAGTSFVSACPAAAASCASTSALNVYPGVDVANEITVPVAADGKITLYNNAGSINLVADLAGYVTGGYTAVGPTRVLDTRTGTGAPAGKVGPTTAISLTVPNLPTGTKAVVLNLTGTALAGAPTTFVSACPANLATSCTATSAINAYPGVDVPNEVTVPVASDGKVTLYNNAGSIYLVADLAGYFTG